MHASFKLHSDFNEFELELLQQKVQDSFEKLDEKNEIREEGLAELSYLKGI